jgi:hypothetical protein
MLYAIGLDTVGKVADANPEDVYTRIRNMNNEKQIFKGQIGMNDMRILVHEANNYPWILNIRNTQRITCSGNSGLSHLKVVSSIQTTYSKVILVSCKYLSVYIIKEVIIRVYV